MEMNSNIPQNINEYPAQKRKNRTLQFYKFLLNSLKMEISLNEFMKLIKYSNQAEIAIWAVSIILYYSGNTEYPLVWLHMLHLFRGILGIVIAVKLPRSYELVQLIDSDDKVMENKIYNDVMRDSVKEHIIPRIKDMKGYLLAYFAMTFVNFMIDVVDFLYIISNLNSTTNNQASAIVFFIIVFVYIVIDLSYVFWTHSLKYTYSKDMLSPINEAFSGVIQKLKSRLKLGKKLPEPEEEKKEQFEEVEGGANKFAKNEIQMNPNPNNQYEMNVKDQNQINLEFKKQSVGKINKGYDEIQIDFDAKNQQKNNF
jgi:hypothetical protein